MAEIECVYMKGTPAIFMKCDGNPRDHQLTLMVVDMD